MTARIYNVYTNGMRIGPNEVFLGPQLVTDAGVYFPEYGGYYAGGNIIVDGTEYMIIIAPRSQGQGTVTDWSPISFPYSGIDSKNDGKGNMTSVIGHGINNFPAFKFCNDLSINGFDDWHLPSGDELEVCYRYLKPSSESNDTNTVFRNQPSGFNPSSNPTGDSYTSGDPTQTLVTDFQDGGSQAFDAGARYWTSTQYSDDSAYQMDFGRGFNLIGLKTASGYTVRAVRWVEV